MTWRFYKSHVLRNENLDYIFLLTKCCSVNSLFSLGLSIFLSYLWSGGFLFGDAIKGLPPFVCFSTYQKYVGWRFAEILVLVSTRNRKLPFRWTLLTPPPLLYTRNSVRWTYIITYNLRHVLAKAFFCHIVFSFEKTSGFYVSRAELFHRKAAHKPSPTAEIISVFKSLICRA